MQDKGSTAETTRFYDFGPFRIDINRRILLRHGERVPLTVKAFDTLLALIERRGRVVEKDDLMEQLWPNTAVQESNLSQQIFTLRRVLGESADDPQFIATVPRRGYRFVGAVTCVDAQWRRATGTACHRHTLIAGSGSRTGRGAQADYRALLPLSQRGGDGRTCRICRNARPAGPWF